MYLATSHACMHDHVIQKYSQGLSFGLLPSWFGLMAPCAWIAKQSCLRAISTRMICRFWLAVAVCSAIAVIPASDGKAVYCGINWPMTKLNSSAVPVGCTAPVPFLCQAITDGELYLNCTVCQGQGQTKWKIPNAGSAVNLTLDSVLHVDGNVVPGCYKCFCGFEDDISMHINVTVLPEKNITYLIKPGSPGDDGHMESYPNGGKLSRYDPGYIYVCANATAYPNVRYQWSVQPQDRQPAQSDIAGSPCFSLLEDGMCLVLLPCARNIDGLIDSKFTCTLYNGVSQNITPFATGSDFEFNLLDDWLLPPHPLQSGPLLTRSEQEGSFKGYVAALKYWDSDHLVKYEICKIPPNLSYLNASLFPSCYYDQLNCCTCDLTCNKFNLTSKFVRNKFDQEMMFETDACEFHLHDTINITMFVSICNSINPSSECYINRTTNVVQLLGIGRPNNYEYHNAAQDCSPTVVAIAIPTAGMSFFLGLILSLFVFLLYRKRPKSQCKVANRHRAESRRLLDNGNDEGQGEGRRGVDAGHSLDSGNVPGSVYKPCYD